MMILGFAKFRAPQGAGIVCALLATCLGLFYLVAAAAPAPYLVVNGVAFILGIVALGGFGTMVSQSRRITSAVMVGLGLLLLATALFGTAVDGASRWIFIGPLSVQVSLVVLPFMIVAFARQCDALGTAAIATAAAALALQPDRAMSGVLALSMAILAVAKPGRLPTAALAIAAVGFAVTLAQPDSLPAVPYVDQILFTAFDVHSIVGAAVLLGAVILLIPAMIGARGDPARLHVHWVFGGVWLGCVLAAALGNYPTPVVGYGGSAILGYLLSLSPLSARHSPSAATGAEARKKADGDRRSAVSERALPV